MNDDDPFEGNELYGIKGSTMSQSPMWSWRIRTGRVIRDKIPEKRILRVQRSSTENVLLMDSDLLRGDLLRLSKKEVRGLAIRLLKISAEMED
jgi:hypothetical protein